MQFDDAKAVYRRAIDATASDGEGKVWWAGVTDEIAQVVEAESDQAGAVIIAWWHHDWSSVGDTPLAAAGRIIAAARELNIH